VVVDHPLAADRQVEDIAFHTQRAVDKKIQGYLDFFIDRPLGMKGYILNLTIRGEGVINNHGEPVGARAEVDPLVIPLAGVGMAAVVMDLPRREQQHIEWLNWPTIFAQTGFFRPDEQWQARFGELFGQIVDAKARLPLLVRTEKAGLGEDGRPVEPLVPVGARAEVDRALASCSAR
jgi:hypothetical protein